MYAFLKEKLHHAHDNGDSAPQLPLQYFWSVIRKRSIAQSDGCFVENIEGKII
jgi:hypothetical protein